MGVDISVVMGMFVMTVVVVPVILLCVVVVTVVIMPMVVMCMIVVAMILLDVIMAVVVMPVIILVQGDQVQTGRIQQLDPTRLSGHIVERAGERRCQGLAHPEDEIGVAERAGLARPELEAVRIAALPEEDDRCTEIPHDERCERMYHGRVGHDGGDIRKHGRGQSGETNGGSDAHGSAL